ncbi:MAG: extracellular solute-binding protein [Treponema sp.]|jgi:putative spermidine/putrescine transport system substrate-binding protein|nr:extracellular solute-binding protein [Treponema sp.]
MKKGQCLRVVCGLLGLLILGSCSGKKQVQAVDLASLSMDELIARAKEEGHVESVGMPDDWANWGDSWKAITQKYGITHHDTDMSSAEELATFDAEKDSPTRDIGDVGQGNSNTAIEMGVVQGYKPSTWDSIPAWAKDPEGRWIISYIGTIAVLVNKDLSGGQEIRSWQELKNSRVRLTLGNPAVAAVAQMGVLSAAYAFGGGIDNVQPGIDFFRELAQAGRLDSGAANPQRFSMGEIEAAVSWDYYALAWRDQAVSVNPNTNAAVHVFSDGAVQSGYSLVFNKYAPHPHATALTIEYLLSDEGQIDRARGYASPIRNVVLPADIQAKMIDRAEYAAAVPLTDPAKLNAAVEQIVRKWEDEVMPLLN